MEIRYPSYYKKFHCIAGDCPDTCCAGWEIPVDRASERRYKEAQKCVRKKNRAFAQKLKKNIKNGRIISEGVTCPFLNGDGLCEMYLELGPESLCHTCARHPRHMEDYGNLHEMVLLMSCPEAARLVLEENDGGFYVRTVPDRTGNMDGVDAELLDVLLQTRELIWKFVKQREEQSCDSEIRHASIDGSMMLAMALVHDVQRRIRTGDYQRAKAVLARYDATDTAERFVRQWKKKHRRTEGESKTENEMENSAERITERFLLMSDFMEELSGLETVCSAWPEMLEACRTKLYHEKNSREMYLKRRAVSASRQCGEHGVYDQDFGHVFQYFVYSFFLASLYDGDALTKIKMAVLCTMAIEELYMAAEELGIEALGLESFGSESLDLEDRINICHALARQIENSDENRSALEQFLKQETFSARRIIDALI